MPRIFTIKAESDETERDDGRLEFNLMRCILAAAHIFEEVEAQDFDWTDVEVDLDDGSTIWPLAMDGVPKDRRPTQIRVFDPLDEGLGKTRCFLMNFEDPAVDLRVEVVELDKHS
jgi:hypothetical protein